MKRLFAILLSIVLVLSLCACNSTTESKTETDVKATVKNNDNKTEYLTAKELCDFSSNNNISFENKYWCAHATVTGKIKEIGGSCIINGHSYNWTLVIEGGACDWFIGSDKYNKTTVTKDFIANLNPGDTVEISGEIVGASMGQVNISNGTISVKIK